MNSIRPLPSGSGWGNQYDLLTSYNGTEITYDELGNPLSYYNGSAYTFTWEGRRLVGAVKGSKTMSFTYDDEGLRTSKTVNGLTTEYFWYGTRLVAEKNANELILYIYDANTCRFINADGYISTGQGLLGYNMFAYCNNNPVNRVDPTGQSWVFWLLSFTDPVTITANVTAAVVSAASIAITNYTVTLGMALVANNDLQDHYSKEESEKAIEEITGDKVTYNPSDVELTNSINLKSRYDRLRVAEIIRRTGDGNTRLTKRSAIDISAEILGHNVIYCFEPSDRTANANIDYVFWENTPGTEIGEIIMLLLGFV